MAETVYNPPAGHWGALRAGDIDTRTKNFSPDLSQIPDTIGSVSSVNIKRTDGVTMGGQDLALASPPGLDSTGMLVTLQLNQGVAGVTYNVEIVVITTGGRTIGRDTEILVAGAVG